MPSWTIHLAIVNQVCKEIRVPNQNIFTFANLMPDIFEGHNTPNPSIVVKDYSTHYPYRETIHGMKVDMPDVKRFQKQYQAQFQNPVILGYYTHLLTDYYWNKQLYENHYEMHDKEKGLLKITLQEHHVQIFPFLEIQKIKHRDLHVFEQYLRQHRNIEYPCYDEKIQIWSQALQEFTYTNEDIQKTFQYIEETMKHNQEMVEEIYQLYSKQELLNYVNESVEMIKEAVLESIGI